MNNTLPKWYVSAKKRLDHIFTQDNFQGVVEESQSPCGRYLFIVTKYSTDPRWCYHQGFICNRADGFGPSFAMMRSTAAKFWHCWIVQGNKLYLICNEDEQGYTVVDVNNKRVHPYIDKRTGWSFSWRGVKPSPDGKVLAVQGDYMQMNNEIALYDFANPTCLPLPKLKRLDTGQESILQGWDGDKVIMTKHTGDRNVVAST